MGQVSAHDDDLGVNGHFSYQVVSDWANDVFSLNPQTGVFTLTSRLDFEDVSSLHNPFLAEISRVFPECILNAPPTPKFGSSTQASCSLCLGPAFCFRGLM